VKTITAFAINFFFIIKILYYTKPNSTLLNGRKFTIPESEYPLINEKVDNEDIVDVIDWMVTHYKVTRETAWRNMEHARRSSK